MASFILYGTEGCHLCEDAEQLVKAVGLVVEPRDIIDDEPAQQRYAIRIPVLLHQPSGHELGWPFSAEEILEFVGQLGQTTSD